MGYIFNPQQPGDIAENGVGPEFDGIVRVIVNELAKAYPGHVETQQDWIFNLARAATEIMVILHGSLAENLILFGTPIRTEAFSGRYRLDIYDFILAGKI